MSSNNKPPGPDGLPLVGIAYHFAREPFQFREDCASEYGDVVTMPGIGGTDDYMLIHPDHIERVLQTEWEDYVGAPQGELEELLGNGLLINEGESWQQQRQLMQPAFFRQRLERYTRAMVEYSERLVDEEWGDGDIVDVEREMRNLTLQIIVQSMFGQDIKNEQSIIGDAFKDIGKRFKPSRSKWPIPNWIPTPANVRFRNALEDIDEIIYEMIDERRGEADERDDLLAMLLQAQDDEGEGMSDKQLRDEMMTMLLAGHDTTALSITYTWHLIANNPEVEERLRTELDDVLGDDFATFEELPRLEYLEKVIKESMRLYPAVHSISRRAVTDVEFDGYPISEGSRIFLAPWVTHRDGRFWDEPETFRPGRWDEANVEARPEYAYFPFGGGPRRCIGKKFAMLEAKLIISTILQKCTLEPEADESLDLVASITAQPKDGIDMRVRHRD